jgi:hypothetical protein
MDNESVHSVLAAFSVILALIGLYIVTRIWVRWEKLNFEVIKARVFLNKKFLEKNWVYVFLTGAAVSLHQSLELAKSFKLISETGLLYSFSEILAFLSMVFLVALAYEWLKMVSLKKQSPNA